MIVHGKSMIWMIRLRTLRLVAKWVLRLIQMPWSIYEIMQMIEYMEADEWSETFDNWYLAVGMTHMKELAQCTTKDDDMLFKSIMVRKKLWDELSSRFGKITNTRAKATNKNKKGVDVIRIFDKAQNGI